MQLSTVCYGTVQCGRCDLCTTRIQHRDGQKIASLFLLQSSTCTGALLLLHNLIESMLHSNSFKSMLHSNSIESTVHYNSIESTVVL